MKVVGVIGGIGAGKTTVCRCLEKLQVPVYYADVEAKKLMNSLKCIQEQLVGNFGAAVLRDGLVDFKSLGVKVFANPHELEKLNGIVHPEVFKHFVEWVRQQDSALPFVCIESAVLFESGMDSQVDKLVLVDAPKSVRVARIIARDGLTETAAEARIASQMSTDALRKKADWVLDTNENKLLLPEIVKLYNILQYGRIL